MFHQNALLHQAAYFANKMFHQKISFNMKASIVYFPNKLKKNSKTGKIPVYMRICYKRAKAETRLNIELLEQDILKWDPITMRLMERNSPANHQLNRLDQKFQEFITLNITQLPKYSASYIKDYVLGNDLAQQKSVMKFIDDYFTGSVMQNVSRTAGTIKNYRRSINHFRNFLSLRKQVKLIFEQVDFELAQDFKNYLVNSNPAMNRIGMTEVSASGVIKKFRTIFSQAVDKDLLTKNPFKLVKIKTKSPRRERLTIQQVKDIYQLDLTYYPSIELYRDIFLFGVFTGLAYQDTMSLTWQNLETRESNNIKLVLRRIKSDVITESFLPDFAIQIASKYKEHIKSKIPGGVLPHRSNKEVNSKLKFLAHLTNIPIKLSTHIGRHTFRQLLAESEIEDYGVIKRMMGQSRNGDVDETYYSITESRLLSAKNKFESFLKKNLFHE
jgi:site-specific recombinase XerD